jgi:hypothetical protein
MTQAERVLDYLWSVASNGATNGELARRLGIPSHQTVYTEVLKDSCVIEGVLFGWSPLMSGSEPRTAAYFTNLK